MAQLTVDFFREEAARSMADGCRFAREMSVRLYDQYGREVALPSRDGKVVGDSIKVRMPYRFAR